LYEEDPDDATYVYESDDDDEPLEYDSNDEEDDDSDGMTKEGSEIGFSQNQESDTEDESIFDIKGLDLQEYDTEFLTLSAPYEDEKGTRKDDDVERDRLIMALPAARKYEHIAGPGCRNTRGFHGDMITAEEMMDCQTVQGIFRKSEQWKPRDDDMDFERTSQHYALTGLSDFMPASGAGLRCAPPRGEADNCDATNDSDLWCVVCVLMFFFSLMTIKIK
jgi:hypothetical protein